MRYLGIETSGEFAILLVADTENGLIGYTAFAARRCLSKRLMSELHSLLNVHNFSLDEIDGYAVGIGPGSFTGVRVGVTTVKTLAQVMNKPVVGISTMAAHANPVTQYNADATVMVVLPSKRGEAYSAQYFNGKLISPPYSSTLEILNNAASGISSSSQLIICGSPDLVDLPKGATFIAQLHVPPLGFHSIASWRFESGAFNEGHSVDPEYIVEPAISVPRDLGLSPVYGAGLRH